ncbi:tail fiber domain-containing protein [Erwinia sp. 9145]|uniref:tail fiber domain-containing protein n=1 Tax=Erwinia sp. 9145 TaxID=1500895 RepID=UPI00068AA8EA|nr:tail fiber domain-containing protein [Erwinia sp. 9145]
MPAGTISVTNNSATVSGTGTSFTSELKPGDFIGIIAGGAPYTLVVASIASDTQLTIGTAYTGPTTSNLAWYGVPATLMFAITQQTLNDMAANLRGMNTQMVNWQKIYSDAQSVTVERSDKTTFTGPSWGYMAAQYANKVDKTSLGNSATRNVGTTAGTVAAGDDARLSSINGMSGGGITSSLAILNNGNLTIDTGSDYLAKARLSINSSGALLLDGSGSPAFDAGFGFRCRAGSGGAASGSTFLFNWTGSVLQAWVNNNSIGNVTVATNSDILLKKDVAYRDDYEESLAEVIRWRPAVFKYKARGFIPETEELLGFIANDLIKVSPECVKGEGLKEGYDDKNPEGAYYLDQVAMITKLAGAVMAINEKLEQRDAAITELQSRLKAFDGLDA